MPRETIRSVTRTVDGTIEYTVGSAFAVSATSGGGGGSGGNSGVINMPMRYEDMFCVSEEDKKLSAIKKETFDVIVKKYKYLNRTDIESINVLKKFDDGTYIFYERSNDELNVFLGYLSIDGFQSQSNGLVEGSIVLDVNRTKLRFSIVEKIPEGKVIEILGHYDTALDGRYVIDNTCFSSAMIVGGDGIVGGLQKVNINQFLSQLNDIKRQYMYTIRSIESIKERKPNTRITKYQSNKKGNYVNHSIPFSCEIECYGKDKKTVAELSKELSAGFGISRDGSLTSQLGYPIEVQTPILAGKKGEITIAEMLCQKLVDKGFMVDKTCGMHIHLDGGDMIKKDSIKSGQERPDKMFSLYLFHRLFEDVIVSFLPSTRRLNRYCAQFKNGVEYDGRSLKFEGVKDSFNKIKKMKTLEDFALYWYKVRNMSEVHDAQYRRYTIYRYMGINFHSLIRDNHIEVRYHSGTINYEKILYWIDLHGCIFEACMNGSINESVLTEILKNNQSMEQLTQTMFSLLQLNNDTKEYLLHRQSRFVGMEDTDEILIDKTKKINTI